MKWLSVHLTHNVSLSATYEFWKLGLAAFPLLMQFKEEENISRKTPQFVQLRRKLYQEMCPKVHLDFEYMKQSSKETVLITSASKTPTQIERNPDYVKKCESAHFKVITYFLPRSYVYWRGEILILVLTLNI